MHSPRPYGLYVKGGSLTNDDLAFIESTTRRLTNLKELHGVDSLKMVRTLPSGGIFIAQDAGGVFKVIAQPTSIEDTTEAEKKEELYIPMLFSGRITKAVLNEGEGVGIRLTEQCRRRLVGYSNTDLPEKDQELQRFNIEYDIRLQEHLPDNDTVVKYTQYAALRPTWYSGAMAELVQIVGGYGKSENIPETAINPLETIRMELPDDVRKSIERELDGRIFPCYKGVPNADGKIKMDYKFHNTNGIGFDSAGKPWLLQFAQGGSALAMPLPVVPATTTAAFREYIEDKADDEILSILDRFGGMPTGEAFPVGLELAQWKRAGVVVSLADISGFYSLLSYSTACGWSFNRSGTEAFNTGYDYEEDGTQFGVAWTASLDLNPAEDIGAIRRKPAPDSNLDAIISGYIDWLVDKDSKGSKELTILYKLYRSQPADILARAQMPVKDKVVETEYWDSLQMAAIAVHNCTASQTHRGYLYSEANFFFQPQAKFPEPFYKACVSHDFLPNTKERKSPRCNTVMFGWYIGDELNTLRYFRDTRSKPTEVESDFEECMIVGSWTETVKSGGSEVAGNFYTNNIDERDEIFPTVKVTRITGNDLGYSDPIAAWDGIFYMGGTLYRQRFYSTKTEVKTTNSNGLALAVAVPYLCRNAMLYAVTKSHGGGSESGGTTVGGITDPTAYRFWTYHFALHYLGGAEGNEKPYPVNANPVWLSKETTLGGGACSDFAQSGGWYGAPADITAQIRVFEKNGGLPRIAPDGYSRSVAPETTGKLMGSLVKSAEVINNKVPAGAFYTSSPDQYDFWFYEDATGVVFGDSEYFSATVPDDHGNRWRYGASGLVGEEHGSHHFVGVIHE